MATPTPLRIGRRPRPRRSTSRPDVVGSSAGSCQACGSTDRPSVAGAQGSRIARCGRCGLGTLLDRATPEELDRLYRSDLYSTGMPRAEPVVRAAQRLIGKLRLRTLEGRSSGRLLDVGSGKGHFLDAARRAGWTVTGLEYSEAAAKEGRRRYGVDTIIGDWASAPLEGPYDVISMWHVLEHLDDPREALRRARALIAPDGLLVVSVPNSASLQARLFRGTWFHLDLPRHLYHFTPRALRQLVESAGFEVAAVDTIAPEMEVIGVVASVANRLGGEPNAALRFLKRDATVRSTTAVVAAFAVAALFAPLAGILAIVAPAVGRGASIQLVARPAIVSTEERRPTA